MRDKNPSFTFLYWIAVILFIIIVSYTAGKEKLAKYDFTEGKVVDRLLLRTGGRRTSHDAWFAQWQYAVDRDTFLFVDKRWFNRLKKIGTRRKIIYLKEKHEDAMVYSAAFWIDLPFILVTIMIAVFIFVIGHFVIHWNDKEWFSKWHRRY